MDENVKLELRDEKDSSIYEDITSTGNLVTLSDWHQIAYTITWSQVDYQSNFEFYINGVSQGLAGTIAGWIYDRLNNKHLLGAELNSSAGSSQRTSFYRGMIWSLCYWAKEVTEFTVLGACESTGPRCENCPGHGEWDCVIDCNWDEWLNGETCEKCDDSCTEGCVRAENCIPCFDDTCENCPMWTDCESCIDNAIEVDG